MINGQEGRHRYYLLNLGDYTRKNIDTKRKEKHGPSDILHWILRPESLIQLLDRGYSGFRMAKGGKWMRQNNFKSNYYTPSLSEDNRIITSERITEPGHT